MTTTLHFADRIIERSAEKKSILCAGFDPILDQLPPCIVEEAKKAATPEERVFRALNTFCSTGLDAVAEHVVAIKPNAAFFEQYGIGGLRALVKLCEEAQQRNIPVIIDAKRGDIGSTAQAYSRAFLGTTQFGGDTFRAFPGDAVTVSGFLGVDTLTPFTADATLTGRGIFVLVRTSNPGAPEIQNSLISSKQQSVSEYLAQTLASEGARSMGASGFSLIGAVVGATYPEEAKKLRSLLPNALFLIPGFGAQGGTADDAVISCIPLKDKKHPLTFGGGIVNASRGLMGTFSSPPTTVKEFQTAVSENAKKLSGELVTSLSRLR